MSGSSGSDLKAVFVFPQAAGHVNPSLPLVRGLVSRGWQVDYLSVGTFRDVIEATGAAYVDRDVIFARFGIADLASAYKGLDYGEPASPQWALNFGSLSTLLTLPVYLAWLHEVKPDLLVYCPVLSHSARMAALRLGVAHVSVLTASGPGFYDAALAAVAGPSNVRVAAAGLVGAIATNSANAKALEGIRAILEMPDLALNTEEPLAGDHYASVNLVTTTAELADPLGEADERWYREHHKRFVFVGPLLSSPDTSVGGDVLDALQRALDATKKIVYVSMGTVLTSDNEEHGWGAYDGSAITGGDMCRAVFRAVFRVFGSLHEFHIIVSTGEQAGALAGVHVPPNATCAPRVPQVELLRRGRPVLFVTHGGQNSLMESASVGTPLVVCPGFGDQMANGQKVERQGWGCCVARPQMEPPEGLVMIQYQQEIEHAICRVKGSDAFKAKAQDIAEGMQTALGVEGAISVLLETVRAHATGDE